MATSDILNVWVTWKENCISNCASLCSTSCLWWTSVVIQLCTNFVQLLTVRFYWINLPLIPLLPSPPLDNIRVMVVVWRLRGNIIRTALCWIVWHNVHSLQHTYMSSSCRSNRLGLSHWDPYAVRRGGCLELYYCNMVEWFWCDSSLISMTNWFPSVLWHCWFGHLSCKNRPRNDLLCVEWCSLIPLHLHSVHVYMYCGTVKFWLNQRSWWWIVGILFHYRCWWSSFAVLWLQIHFYDNTQWWLFFLNISVCFVIQHSSHSHLFWETRTYR